MDNHRYLSGVLAAWGFVLKTIRSELSVPGSPERCMGRVVAETGDGSLLLMENIPGSGIPRKKRIIEALNFLVEQGLRQVRPYLLNREAAPITEYEGRFWQVTEYVPGVPLNRPAYVFEGWRGTALADFLLSLRRRSGRVPGSDEADVFSIVNFIRDLKENLTEHDPAVLDRIRPAFEMILKALPARHDALPVAFCHGDFHPLNVIWSARGIQAVIDWEFLGPKPEIYDTAMLVGCAGMEQPACLTGDLVHRFLRKLRDAAVFEERSWKVFFEFVLALRLAWLSEWLRKPDPEMVDLECVYINLLIENRERLEAAWELETSR